MDKIKLWIKVKILLIRYKIGLRLYGKGFWKRPIKMNLRGVNLSGYNLEGIDLSGSDLTHANLSFTNLDNAAMCDVNFYMANLEGVILRNASVMRSDFTGSMLNNAVFEQSNIDYSKFRCAQMHGTNFSSVKGTGVCFEAATMYKAILKDANLFMANFAMADLDDSSLVSARLVGSDFHDVGFFGCDMSYAVINACNLRSADLIGAKLEHVIYDDLTTNFAMQCPEKGSFIGFKKVDNKIVELEIPAEARRSSATTRKCRCEYAKVLSITSIGGDRQFNRAINSNYCTAVYEVGKTVYADSWDEERWRECSHGIHFFLTKGEAINY